MNRARGDGVCSLSARVPGRRGRPCGGLEVHPEREGGARGAAPLRLPPGSAPAGRRRDDDLGDRGPGARPHRPVPDHRQGRPRLRRTDRRQRRPTDLVQAGGDADGDEPSCPALPGKPVLTWYEGEVLGAYGGDFVVADQSYREVARVKAGHGEHGDLHEFLLTSRGTALITIYSNIPADLTSVGGSAAGQLTEGVIQELDVPTGKVLFEWRSSAHIGLDESLLPSVKDDVADYFHLNSVGVDTDGHLLVSARHTCAIYKLHRQTGAILWRLGGKRSDFMIVPGAEFSFQHDVRRHADGTLTIFDNNAAAPTATTHARPLRLRARHERDDGAPRRRIPARQPACRVGDGESRAALGRRRLRRLGTAGAFTEFAPDGTVRFDASLADGSVTYRAFRAPWVGRPAEPPKVAITRQGGSAIAHVSWNGATEVAKWRADMGSRQSALHPVATARRTGVRDGGPPRQPQGIPRADRTRRGRQGARYRPALHRLV